MDRYLASWERELPDYTVVRWDEGNAPTGIPYVRTTLEHGLWSKASNAVRLHALREHGGIYLDTDVEVLGSFDTLLGLGCFVGFQYQPDEGVNRPLDMSVNGAVFGARRRHPFVVAALERLEDEYDGLELPTLTGPGLVSKLADRARAHRLLGQPGRGRRGDRSPDGFLLSALLRRAVRPVAADGSNLGCASLGEAMVGMAVRIEA